MRFAPAARLKKTLLSCLLLIGISASVLVPVIAAVPQKATAQDLGYVTFHDAFFDFRYVISHGNLYIRAYLKSDDKPREAVASWKQSSYGANSFNPNLFVVNRLGDGSDAGPTLSSISSSPAGTPPHINLIREMPDIGGFGGGKGRVYNYPLSPNAGSVEIDIERQDRFDAVRDAWNLCKNETNAEGCMDLRLAAFLQTDTPGEDIEPVEEDTSPSCEEEGGDMSWILCPVLYAVDGIIQNLDEQIRNLLYVPNSYIENPGVKTAWAQFRNIAYIILVPIMLVMVIGTALGFDFVSAYTVKRALPRLIAATLFIALSWEFVKFLVIFTNNVGTGIGGLISGAFGGVDDVTLASVMNPNWRDSTVAGAGAFATLVIGFPLAIAQLPVILLFAATSAAGLFLGILLLSFRQLLIIALMLLAPLAILAWIFPGNDKLWKLWWGTFSKLLMLFPLIIIVITVGKAFAQLVADTEGSLVGTLLKCIAYVGPYFMIPGLFKFAGGIFATISGVTNDKSRGFFDKAKKSRQERTAQNWRNYKAGSLPEYSVMGRQFGKRGNAFGRHMGAGYKGRYGFGKTGKVAMANLGNAEVKEIAGENDAFARRMVDETTMAAVAMGNDVSKMLELKYFSDMAKQPGGMDKVRQIAAAGKTVGNDRRTRVAASKALAQSGKIIEDQSDVETLLASVSGGDQSVSNDLRPGLQYTWRGSGRNDVGRGTLEESLAEMNTQSYSSMKPLGTKGMFGDPRKLEAALGKLDPQQRRKVVQLMASDSPYLDPTQTATIKRALDHLETSPVVLPAVTGPDEKTVTAPAESIADIVREVKSERRRTMSPEDMARGMEGGESHDDEGTQ